MPAIDRSLSDCRYKDEDKPGRTYGYCNVFWRRVAYVLGMIVILLGLLLRRILYQCIWLDVIKQAPARCKRARR